MSQEHVLLNQRSPAQPGFFDNLIPLRGGLDGPQYAGWVPQAPVSSGLGCVMYADQMIPVDSGVALAADVYLPNVAGHYPAVLAFSAYSKEVQTTGAPTGTNETGSPPIFTDRGYAHVIVARRGMGRSQGESVAFFSDADVEDHATVIAWVAAQPWCDGNVVLFGTSYYGMVQPLVAVTHPPALKGFFASELCTDYFGQIVMFGGAPQIGFLSLWMGANFTDMQFTLHVPPVLRALVSQVLNSPLKRWWWPQVQKRLSQIMYAFRRKTPATQMNQFLAEMLLDSKTRATSVMPPGPSAELDAITVPFVVVQNPGYFNLHQFGSYDLFSHASTPRDRKWLIIAPASYELPCYHWQLEALAFFDHIVHGAENGYRSQAPLRYWIDGDEAYRSAADFPLPSSSTERFYLASGGADTRMHHLARTGDATGTNRWAAVPFGAITTGGFDAVANPILSYELPMHEAVEFSGPISASLCFSCNEIDSHVVVRLSRIDRTGALHMLSLGTIRPAYRTIDPARSTATEIVIDMDVAEPLVSGVPVTLRFSLTPQPVLFAPGERLRFDIASRTDVLRSDQSHGYAQFDMQVPPYYARNTVHYGPDTFVALSKVKQQQ